jgi:hypothetical protein
MESSNNYKLAKINQNYKKIINKIQEIIHVDKTYLKLFKNYI